MKGIKIRYKFWLETREGESIMGDGTWELLQLIRSEGSLMAAVQKKGYSYRKTWNKLKDIENKLGFALLEKQRGGSSGGSSMLTEKAESLIGDFELLHRKSEVQINDIIEGIENKWQ